MITSSSIHFVQMTPVLSFPWLSSIPLYVHVCFLLERLGVTLCTVYNNHFVLIHHLQLCVYMYILICVCVCVCVCACTHSCTTLCNPMDCSPLGFSVHGSFQARILVWVAIFYSRDLPNPGIGSASLMSPVLAGEFFPTAPPERPIYMVI